MFKFALKNILFYKARSLTTFILIFVSTLMFVIYVAFMNGSHETTLSNALKVYQGTIEIYHKNYREEGGSENLIDDVATIKSKLDGIESIVNYSERYETLGLLSLKDTSKAALVVGINPEQEAKISQVKQALVEGEYLNQDSGNCLYAGVDLVKKFKAKLGDELSFVGSASDDSFAADLFKLCGIFRTGAFDFDSMGAFVSKKYFDGLMLSENMATYIALRIKEIEAVDKVNQEIIRALDDINLEPVTWKVLMKSLVQLLKVDNVFAYISIAIFFIVVFFVIMIFGFINVSSRVREFGTLRCIGLSKVKVWQLMFFEIIIISSLAIILATPLGAYFAYYYSIHPIVIEGMAETYKQYGLVSDAMNTSFQLKTIAWNVAVIYLLGFISIIYPTLFINHFKPIEATRHV